MTAQSPTLDKIAAAYSMVTSGVSKRIDGDGWKVFSMGEGNLVRIDIDPKVHPQLTPQS